MKPDSEEFTDTLSALPNELWLYVFQFLPLDTLLICENVCQRWRELTRDISIWKNILIVYSGKPGQTETSEKNLQVLTSHSQYINCVKLQYVYNYKFIKSVLEKCPNITSLELVMCRIGTEFTNDLSMWPHLKKLNLKNSIILDRNGEMLINFDNFREMTYVALSDFGLSSANCKSLINCKYLNHIYIEKIKTLSFDDVRELILSKRKNLVSLHIYGGESVNDKCLQLLSKCFNLKDLAVIRSENVTDEGLLPLACLRQLEHLQIWNNTNFSELALLSTFGCPNLFKLSSLSLSRIQNVTPVIVDVISEYYKDLKFLALYQCPKIINTDYEKQLKAKFRNIDVVLY